MIAELTSYKVKHLIMHCRCLQMIRETTFASVWPFPLQKSQKWCGDLVVPVLIASLQPRLDSQMKTKQEHSTSLKA